MKNLLTINLILILLLVGLSASGLTITSVASGTFDNTAVWDCVCIPGGPDDVTIDANDTITLSGNISINDLSIDSAGILYAGSYNITVAGNWSNSGTFHEQASTVTFSSSTQQSITNINKETFYNLTINKSAGDVSVTNLNISNILDLASGDIILGSNSLVMNNNSSISGSPGSGSYIQAQATTFRKYFNTAGSFTFPCGDSSNYSPITVTINSATFSGDDFISVKLSALKHVNILAGSYIKRYWKLKSGGLPTVNFDVSCEYVDSDIIGAESSLLAAKYESSTWINYGTVDTTNNLVQITGITNAPNNIDITGGSAAALPITLSHFEATVMDDQIALIWRTSFEYNLDRFDVERSTDGFIYESISTIKAKGFSSMESEYQTFDSNPIVGLTYYRLKQIDLDGSYSYSSIRFTNYDGPDFEFTCRVFPNPSNGNLINVCLYKTKAKEVTVNLYDVLGRNVINKVVETQDNRMSTTLSHPVPGLYILVVNDDNYTYTNKIEID